MAHEMVHLHQRENKLETSRVSHDAMFKKFALDICEIHGFDPHLF
jgi:hypothetical protein